MKRATILSCLGAAAVACALACAPAVAGAAPSPDDTPEQAPATSTATVVANLSGNEKSVELSATGQGVQDASRVLFRVWPEARGAGNAISYEAVRGEDGSWHATAFIAGDPAGSYGVPYSCDVSGAVHRLYNPWSAAHLFTSSTTEADGLAKSGWRYEGVAWIEPEEAAVDVPSEDVDVPAAGEDADVPAEPGDVAEPEANDDAEPSAGDVPEEPADSDATEPAPAAPSPSAPGQPAAHKPETTVYRLYNRWTTEHFYTMCASEYANLGAQGWTPEGEAFRSDEAEAMPVYRLFNPYETANTHLFTSSDSERQALSAAGWVDEGIAWYGAAVNADATWSAVACGQTFADAGNYQVEAVALPAEGDATSATSATDAASAPETVGSATFSVSAPTGEAHVENIDNAHGTFDVVVDEIVSPSGVASVQAPTWTRDNGQKDIVWYDAASEGNGSYRAQANVAKHYFNGNFVSHCYVTAGNGVRAVVAQTSAALSLANYAKCEGGPYTYRVSIYNPGNVGNVQMPAWSDAGGQDDLVWYPATNQGNGWWTATIDTVNLRHAGTVHVHIYADGTVRNSLDITVASWELITPEQRAMNERVSGLSSPTSYLLAVDTTNCFVGVYRGSQGNWQNNAYWACAPGAAATPTVKGVFHVGSRGYAFGHGYTCYYWVQFYKDYLFHSIKYWEGTFNVQDGTLGSPKSLGCVRLAIENAKWIYDNVPTGTTVVVY